MSTLPKSLHGLSGVSGLNFRDLLNFNVDQIPFKFPPQVQQGIEAANSISDALGLDVKIPTESELKQMATGELDKILGGLGATQDTLGTIEESLGTAEEVLSSIDWLR